MANPVGCPSSYKREYCQQIIDHFTRPTQKAVYKREYYKDGVLKAEIPIIIPEEMPTFQGFASKLGIHHSTLSYWCEHYPEFSACYALAKQYQEHMILVNGMSKLYDPNFAKFLLMNRFENYAEKVENTNKNMNCNVDPEAIKEIERKMRELSDTIANGGNTDKLVDSVNIAESESGETEVKEGEDNDAG